MQRLYNYDIIAEKVYILNEIKIQTICYALCAKRCNNHVNRKVMCYYYVRE